MLEVNDIHTYYGDSHILQGVSLEVHAGEAVSLLGRNGVGKTTTIRSIMGFTPPRRGSITFGGAELVKLNPTRIARLGIGLVPQGRRIFPDLTVRENLIIAERGNGKAAWTLDRVYGQFPRLRERESNRGNQLSGGEQEMLAIGRALLTNPRLLLMDEPSEGLAPIIVREIGQLIKSLKERGQAMLLVEQNLPLALDVADRVYVMSKGQIVFHGTPHELWNDEALHKQLLGV